ncbi:hypothetical protein DFH07DRAFT_735917 [Mycena maculata]|uniref:RING-type domain-containing protein n=1 Tax=Mycena maculata TaxID=230809 RepID=A0AAD7JQF2_9AGAR|nr:hypothetical protein DFH07DRAFT_735917 [Mycena maculata]
MLSLGPGSACDVCLEPFRAELKAPCSIPCGHVFCFRRDIPCLQHIAHHTCPLCRKPFQERHMIKLHVDLDSIRAPSTEGMPVPDNAEESARQLQKRITGVANEGATEIQTTQLTEECRAFLAKVSKNEYSDLRTAYRMLYYMCQVKRLYVDQGRTVNQLTRNVETLTQEADRLKAAIEASKLEKRRLSAEKDDLSLECRKLHEQLDSAEAQMLLVTE